MSESQTLSRLRTKSAVKGDLFKATEIFECIYINISVSVLDQKLNIKMTQIK